MAESNSYPMLSANNWWNIRKKFKQTIPGTVTASYLSSVLNMQERSATNNIMPCQLYKTYELRALSTPYINNVGTKNHFFPYTETQFFEFDKYLFANWHRDWTIPTL